MSACSNELSPTGPDEQRYSLVGIVRDSSMQPIAGARIEITNGPFAGRFTTSGANGEFQFVDPQFVSEPATLHVFKEGYRPAFATTDQLRTIVTLAPNASEGTITFKAADTCATLPSAVRSRTYTATIDIWEPGSRALVIPLTGADFFAGLGTISGQVGRSGPIAQLTVASYESFQRFLDEEPIYDRLGNGYVSFFGSATTSAPPRENSFTTTFDGTIAYCPNATNRGDGLPPQCVVLEIQCRSNRHELTGTRR